MIAFWILLILFVFHWHFALAAPVAVREMLEVRINAVDVLKDGKAAWERRMDLDDEDAWSTNEGYRKDDNPGRGRGPDNAPAGDNVESENMLGSESAWDSEQMGSDGRGPDPYYNNPPEIDEVAIGNENPPGPEYDEDHWSTNEAYLKDHDPGGAIDFDEAPGDHVVLGWDSEWDSEQMKSDGRAPDHNYNNPPGDPKSGDKDDGGNANDANDANANANANANTNANANINTNANANTNGDGDNAVKSEQASAETTPPTGLAPESEHPATPEHMTDLINLSKGSPKPRNSGFLTGSIRRWNERSAECLTN
jgi:hypothetical protein